MWIFLNNAMLSVVQHRELPESLMVRARRQGDIERVFADCEVTHTPEADYAWRAVIPKVEVAQRLADSVLAIDYDNFKNSIPSSDRDRHDAYLDVWAVMSRWQRQGACD